MSKDVSIRVKGRVNPCNWTCQIIDYRSLRTFWRERPDAQVLKEPSLEVVLPEAATLTSLNPALLVPDVLPGLWRDGTLPLSTLRAYFAGEHVEMAPRDGYEEPVTIPQAVPEVVTRSRRARIPSSAASRCMTKPRLGVLPCRTRLVRTH